MEPLLQQLIFCNYLENSQGSFRLSILGGCLWWLIIYLMYNTIMEWVTWPLAPGGIATVDRKTENL